MGHGVDAAKKNYAMNFRFTGDRARLHKEKDPLSLALWQKQVLHRAASQDELSSMAARELRTRRLKPLLL